MAQRDEVLKYIRSHKPQCDDCIVEQLGYPQRQTVNAHARKLGAMESLLVLRVFVPTVNQP